MTNPAIEAAARALYKQHAVKDGDHCWDDFVPDAEAVLAAVTPMIEAAMLERTAKAFEANEDGHDSHNCRFTAPEVAAALRALKEQP